MNQVSLDKLLGTLDAVSVYRADKESEREYEWAICSDLMSDVLTRDGDGAVLVTSLASVQSLRAADIVGVTAVILSNGKRPDPQMLSTARDLSVSLLTSDRPSFEICVALGKVFGA